MQIIKRLTNSDIFVAFLLVLMLALFCAPFAFAAGNGFSVFNIGGSTGTQIVPLFPTWSINVPLLPPTISAATTTAGGSLTAGSPLYFRVAATNGTGTTTASNEIATTTKAGSQQVNITWTAIPGASKYFVYFSTSTAGAENAYFTATSSTAYDFTSTSSPTAYGTIPGFPSSFAIQATNGANTLTFNGVPELATAAVGGASLGTGQCATATSTISGGSLASTTVLMTTPQKFPGPSFEWNSYALSSTQIVTQVCALLAGTPVSTVYNVRAF